MKPKEQTYAENKLLLSSKANRKCGVKDRPELIITAAEMRSKERAFWAKRGFPEVPLAWIWSDKIVTR